MKEKNIYFHIGPGKTGTSAIQAWLQSNQAWLKKNSVLYPEHELDINNVSSGHRNIVSAEFYKVYTSKTKRIQINILVLNNELAN